MPFLTLLTVCLWKNPLCGRSDNIGYMRASGSCQRLEGVDGVQIPSQSRSSIAIVCSVHLKVPRSIIYSPYCSGNTEEPRYRSFIFQVSLTSLIVGHIMSFSMSRI